MKVRLERASELIRYSQLLEKFNLGNMHQLRDAAKILQDKTKAFHLPKTTSYSCWGYDIENLTFYISPSGRHIYPANISYLEISIDTNVLCSHDSWGSYKDPFIIQKFRAVIRGIDSNTGEYSFGFHIDKHDEELESDEIHPIYHIQYIPRVNESVNTGEVLSMDTPRMMHMPVDLILGLDIVLSNFAPTIWNNMRDENEYHSIFKNYQECFWKPYVHTLAANWSFNQANLEWDGKKLICPSLSD
ncbi:MAG: hypothetical protein AAFY41_01840 [Bacteroidota bacterium]